VACAGAATSRRAQPWETLTLMAASPSLRCTSIPPGRTSHSPSASLPPPDLPVIILPLAARPLSLCDPPRNRFGESDERAGAVGGAWLLRTVEGGTVGFPSSFPPGEARAEEEVCSREVGQGGRAVPLELFAASTSFVWILATDDGEQSK
jgi:hypothetical protein